MKAGKKSDRPVRVSRAFDESLSIQLGLLLETAGAVVAVVGKTLRWGLGASDVATGEPNREALLRDLDDLKASIRRVEKAFAPTFSALPSGGAPISHVAGHDSEPNGHA